MHSDRLRRDVIDGVPVFWTPSTSARYAGALHFRVGISDETVRTRGITHLVEHLALFRGGERSFPFNGSVDHVRTVFAAQGTGAEVAAFLRDVCASLSSLPIDRLAAECRVLKSEAATRTGALADVHLRLRYGARGYGLGFFDELGLHWLDGDALAAWSATRFTRQNAVLSFVGPPPDALHVSLPEGIRHPTVPRIDLRGASHRTWTQLPGVPGITFGVVIGRTSAGAAALRILRRRLEQRLRHELGLSYEVSLGYMPLDRADAVGSMLATCVPDDANRVRNELLSVTDAFAEHGPTEAELAWEGDALARVAADQESAWAELDATVYDVLLEHPVMSFDECLAELRALRPAQARDAFAGAWAGATLVDALDAVPMRGGWAALASAAAPVSGRSIDPAGRRFWQARQEQLTIGPDGVSWRHLADGTMLTVRYEECAALVVDGPVLWLLSHDGCRIVVDQHYWRGGEQIIQEILGAAPRSLVVRVDSART
jgi:hypothetical protein